MLCPYTLNLSAMLLPKHTDSSIRLVAMWNSLISTPEVLTMWSLLYIIYKYILIFFFWLNLTNKKLCSLVIVFRPSAEGVSLSFILVFLVSVLLRGTRKSSLMSYVMAFTVGIIFKSLRKEPYAFLELELGEKHVLASSNCNWLSSFWTPESLKPNQGTTRAMIYALTACPCVLYFHLSLTCVDLLL